MGMVGGARSGKVKMLVTVITQSLTEPMVSLLTRHVVAVVEEFANPAAKMQFTTGLMPMDLNMIVTGMLEMLALVRLMGMIMKPEGTPQRPPAVHVEVETLVFGMLFVQAGE